MSIKAHKINQANAIASGTISAEVVDQKSKAIAQQFAKNANLSGFRKGKAPIHLIKQRFAKQIQQEVEQEAVREGFQEALRELGIQQAQVLGNPAITKFERRGQEIEVEFKISIAPNVDISKIRDCIPDLKLKDPTLKAIDERVDTIAQAQAPLIPAQAKAKITNGNTANIDFEGFIGDRAFEGGKAEGFDLLIGSGQFISGFEEQLIGMKKGEKKDIKVSFPAEYPAKELAGKEAVFKIKLNEIKVKADPKADDALAQKVLNKYDATLQELRDQVKLQLRNEAKAKLYAEEAKPQFVQNILEAISFDLPDLIVEQEVNILLNNYARSLTQEEFQSFQSDTGKIQAKRQELQEEAVKSVKITFIVDAAAKAFGVQIQDNEVMQTLYYEAMMAGQDPKAMLEFYQKNNLLPAVKMAMLEDRILTALLDEKLDTLASSTTNSQESKRPKKDEAKPSGKTSTKEKAAPTASQKVKTKESKAKEDTNTKTPTNKSGSTKSEKPTKSAKSKKEDK